MFEKVNPSHPDKIADRIAGAIVDLAYAKEKDPKIAVEVLIGHDKCDIIIESSAIINKVDIMKAAWRITGERILVEVREYPQDIYLAANQKERIRCGDNGIFKGMPVTEEQRTLTKIAQDLYDEFQTDGKFIINGDDLIICQSRAKAAEIAVFVWNKNYNLTVNPLGYWTGGINVDTGATNRKLGSDMGDSVTGGGLHGKDLSKADVSVNIYAWLKAQETGEPVELFCAIGDEMIDGRPYGEIVEIARQFIEECGGFEKFAEWGLIR